MSTSSSSSSPLLSGTPDPTSLSPSFYASKPHHKGTGFINPWPSAHNATFLDFVRTFFFEWDEKPMPKELEGGRWTTTFEATWGAELSPEERNKGHGIVTTWLGHASSHIQLPLSPNSPRKLAILTDPVFSKRCSPSQFLGPARFSRCPTSVQAMADAELANTDEGVKIWPDVVLISHNHYDHLDDGTIRSILSTSASNASSLPVPYFFSTLGVAKTLRSMGVPSERIVEGDWWDRFDFDVVIPGRGKQGGGEDKVKIGFSVTPAQHFSGRGLLDRAKSLWGGWMVHLPRVRKEGEVETPGDGKTDELRLWFAGDTGLRHVPRGVPPSSEKDLPQCPAFTEIRETLGAPDLALIPIGAYDPRSFMSTIHMNPKDAAIAHTQVGSRRSLGIHWGTFRLTTEEISEPPEWLEREMEERRTTAATGSGEVKPFECVRVGESFVA